MPGVFVTLILQICYLQPVLEKISCLEGTLNKKNSDKLTIIEDSKNEDSLRTTMFDDEGTKIEKKKL